MWHDSNNKYPYKKHAAIHKKMYAALWRETPIVLDFYNPT